MEYVSVASREKLDADDEALLTTARDLLRSYQEDKARRTKRWEKAITEQAEQLKSRIPTTGPGAEPAERPRGSPKAESGHANRRTVFVVHGRDEQARKAVFQFLRSIGLKPLEWSQAVAATGKATPYVGEVLDSAFSLAQAVVVVLTGDDEARLRPELRDPSEPSHEINLTPQARPNVLFEAGMAMARSMDRTVLIELGKLRPFSDIGGRFTVRLDNSTQRRQDFAARLQAAKCEVDLTGTDWHSAGDFEASGV